MACWWKFYIHISFFITLFIWSSCLTIKTIEFAKHNATYPELNLLSCARVAKKDGSCGCKMDIHSMTYDSLWKDGWCSNKIKQSNYVYMETEQITITTSLILVDGTWRINGFIPVCMNIGSVIEINFTPRAGWTRINIFLINKVHERPMRLRIQNNEKNVVFLSRVNCTNCDGHQMNVNQEAGEGFPFVTNENFIIKIEVLQHSYKVYVNGTLYHEFGVMVTDIIPTYMAVHLNDVPSDIHYVLCRKAEDPST